MNAPTRLIAVCPESAESLSDSELLSAWLNDRDEALFAVLVRRHAPLVLGVCKRQCRRVQDVDDAFQATFLCLMQSAHKVRRRDRLASWLYGTAYRVAVAARRRYRNDVIPLVSDPPSENDPLVQIARRHQLRILDEELSKLAEPYRAAIVLHWIDGLATADVADRLGVTVDVVRGRLQRGRGQLERLLRRRGVTSAAVITALAAWPVDRASAAGCADAFITNQLSNSHSILPDNSPLESLLDPGTSTMTWTTTLGCVAAVAIAAITTTTTWNTVGQEPSVIKSVAIDVGRDATPTTILPSNSVLAQFGAAPAAPTAPPTPSAPVAPTPPVAPAAPVPPASPSASSKKLAEMRDMIEQAMLEPATFSVQDVGTETIAQELLKQTRLPFITDARGLAVASEAAASPTFSYQADGLPLQVALRQMLRPAALRADVRDDSIVITADTAELARQGIGAHQWVNVDQEAAIRIAEGLKVRASFEFQEEPLESVISIVSEKMGVPISIDQAGLEENGISRDMLCELNVKDLTLRSTLDSFLDQLELCLTISGEQLVVTSRDAAEQRRLLRVYWIDGLGLPSNDASSLMQLIQSSVNPDTWEELGGPSSISPVGLTPRQRPGLMVATTLDTHMEIESLVQVLRNSHFGPDTGKDIEFPTAGSPTGFGGGMAGGMGGMGGGGGGMGGGGMF